MPSTNPGPTLTIEGGISLEEINKQQNAHKEHLRKHKDYKAVNKATKQLLTDAF